MTAPLTALHRLARRYGPGHEAQKLILLRRLARADLPTATSVERLHEALCWLRAYPDGPELLWEVEAQLASFARRRDLRRHARALRDSGIAGTSIHYRFFTGMARWLAARWPDRLTVEWDETDGRQRDRLEQLLPLLALHGETPGLDEWGFSAREWVGRMKGDGETDAAFLVRRFAALPASAAVAETLFEECDLPLRLAPGPAGPSRTQAKAPTAQVHFQGETPPDPSRPDLAWAVRQRPRAVRGCVRAEGERWIAMAREAMVTRSRDLDAFAHGSPDDVRVVEWGDGLQFVAIGMVPERRLMLEAVYGFLTVKNGVPIGYVLNSALYGSAEIAYNVFETFRGGEAAQVYGRVLATVRTLFGADSFTIYPYQLGGDGNHEGLKSGAWWFYQKLGFRARDPEVLALMERELAAMRRDRAHRTPLSSLKVLGQQNVYWHLGRTRDDVIGELPLANVGLAVTAYLAEFYGSDRDDAERRGAREAARLLGVASPRRGGERLAWRRWAPLVLSLPGVEGWSAAQRRALAAVVRAKGGVRESDFVRAFDAHPALRRALRALAVEHAPADTGKGS